MLHDMRDRYGSLSRTLHWVMAVLIGLQFLKLGDRIGDGEHWIGRNLVPLHVSIGCLLLALVGIRLLWAYRQRNQRPSHEGIAAILVRSGHGLLYACMVLMPVTGVLYILGKGNALKFFGIQLVAKTGVKTSWMAELGALHSPVSWLFVIMVAGHVAIALFDHFAKRDGILRRMLG